MNAVKIVVDVPPKYVQAVEDRQFLKVGQKLTGRVQLDRPGKPKDIQIRWLDANGRLLGQTSGKYEAYDRVVRFEFDLRDAWFPVHYIECEIDGKLQPIREKFFVSPTSEGWETLPAVTWATYPFGDFYDKLQQVGVNGIIAYGMAPFDHVVEHGMKCYVDQMTFWEISTYHRPFRQFWEAPEGYSGVMHPSSPGFRHNWDALLDRYVRVRERCRKEGRTLSRDDHYRKVLHRAWCPNDPGTRTDAGQRFEAVVRQHKGFRPLFYNIADEAGITDQWRPYDFCYCHYCMDKMRTKLEDRYGSLDRLNAEWGTDFATWNDVYPMTTDETMDANAGAVRGGEGVNFASWNDHRDFMDDTFAEFFGEMRRLGRQVDPIGTFSQGGCQWPFIFGGWDYAKVVRTIDAIIPYNGGGNQEMVRSFAPKVKNVSPFFGDHPRQVRQMWFSIIHGDAGLVFWDADGPGGRFVERPSGKLSNRGKVFGPALREFRGGIGQQMAAWNRGNDGIGLFFSQPTERAQWMLEVLPERKKKEWFRRGDMTRYLSTRMSWQQLIEDCQLQYDYVSYLAVEQDEIDLSKFKLIILPQTLAVSDKQSAALRQFVYDGGTLLADGRAGRMTGNCRQRERGALDELFGIRQSGKLVGQKGARLQAVRDGWVGLGKSLGQIKALDAEVQLTAADAEPAARAGKAPAVVRRRVGKGWAVFLNADLFHYEIDRHTLDKPAGQAQRDLLAAVVELAGVTRPVAVEDATLGAPAGIEVTRFTQRDSELVAVITNRQFRQSGIGETLDDKTLDVFELDRQLTLRFADSRHNYNARTGKYLGRGEAVEQTLPSLSPLIVARLNYQVRGVEVSGQSKAVAGQAVALQLAIKCDKADADAAVADHVFGVDVYQPDGTWCYWYSGTTLGRSGRGDWTLPLALNDPAGAWKVVVRDAVTGQSAEFKLRVAKA